MLQRPNCLLNHRNRYQLLTTLTFNLINISHGISIGWLSPSLRKLQSEETPLSFPIGIYEVSWIGSVVGLGSAIGNILIGMWLLERIGRKFCLLLIAWPHAGFWLLVYFAPSVEYLYVGRLLAGLTSGGMYIAMPIFISEIADANIRGTLSAMIMVSVNLGILLGYIIGTHVSYFVIPWLVLICPATYFICNLFMPETPQYLIRHGKYAAAEKSFKYFKNIEDTDSHGSLREFEDLKLALTEHKGLQQDKLSLKDFVSSAALKSYGPALMLVFANQFSGLFVIINYMADIFEESGSTLDPNTCSIIIGVVQICGTYVTTMLVDIYGRKILLLWSTLGVTISLTAFGLFTYYAQHLTEFGWLPLVFMSLNIFMGNIGLVGCFFMLLVELFPAKIRAKATSTSIVLSSCMVFAAMKLFPICNAMWGLSVTMWCCAGISATSYVFFLYFLEETKGKSMLQN